MAYTDADLLAVRAALIRGERVVRFADRSVEYRSVDELERVEQAILAELAVANPTRRPKQVFGVASKGF